MATTNLKKNASGYGYKYTDLAEIHNYLEQANITYYQYTETEDGNDYIYTVPIIDGKEQNPRRGCRIAEAKLSGKSNPAQEQGSAITYARRYSLLMALGLATTDDDAACLTIPNDAPKNIAPAEDAEFQRMQATRITPIHIDTLSQMILDTDTDAVAFMKYYGVEHIEEMTEAQYGDALNLLRQKKLKAEEKGKVIGAE